MEETKSLIIQACMLVRDLKSIFPHNYSSSNSNQMDPNNINNYDIVKITSALPTCEEIIAKFQLLIQNLKSYQPNPLLDYHHHYLQGPPPSSSSLSMQIGGTKNEYYTNMAAPPRTEMILAPPNGHEQEKVLNRRLSAHVEGEGGEDPSHLGGVSSQSRKRRREDPEKRVIVKADEYSNPEMPPDDGHTWRKYGQKVIQDSKFPRSYYRCTHQKYCNCQAKKKVKKLDDDPTKYEVIYIGQHTCHNSPTAPISAPILSPQPLNFNHHQNPHQITPRIIYPQVRPNTWLSTDFNFGGGRNRITIGNRGASGSQHDVDSECTIANMANGMFNSNTDHASNMDLIFQPTKGKDKTKGAN